MKLEEYRKLKAAGGEAAVLKEVERCEPRRNRIKEAEAALAQEPAKVTVQLAQVYKKLLPDRQQTVSYLEEMLAEKLTEAGLEGWVREFRFITRRKFSADFAFPAAQVLVECEGAVHRIKSRFRADIEKYNLAQLEGYLVIRVTRREIVDGRAIAWVKQALLLKKQQNVHESLTGYSPLT